MKTTAQDIMSTEVLTIQEGASIEEALKILINSRITGLPVVNQANEMVGVVSEYDIMKQISDAPNLDHAALGRAFNFTRGAKSISVNAKLDDILHHLIDMKYRRLPVVDQANKLVGIISRRDIMRLFYYRARLT